MTHAHTERHLVVPVTHPRPGDLWACAAVVLFKPLATRWHFKLPTGNCPCSKGNATFMFFSFFPIASIYTFRAEMQYFLFNGEEEKIPGSHLDHVELCDAVLLHAHWHWDAVLLDQHGCFWTRSFSDPVRVSVRCVCVSWGSVPLVQSLYPSSMFKQQWAMGWPVFLPEERQIDRQRHEMLRRRTQTRLGLGRLSGVPLPRSSMFVPGLKQPPLPLSIVGPPTDLLQGNPLT